MVFFLIYSAVVAIINKTPYDFYYLPVLLVVSIILLKFHHRLRKIADFVLVIICLVVYGVGVNGILPLLENNTPYLAFYIGYAFAMFQRLVEARIVKVVNIFLLYLGFLGVRFYIIRFNYPGAVVIQIFFEILLLISNFERERGTRKLFKLFFDYNQELLKFKHLMESYIPANIILFTKDISKTLFVNDGFKSVFKYEHVEEIKSFMKSLIVDPESIEGIDMLARSDTTQTQASLQTSNMEQMVNNFSQLPSSETQKILSFTARFTTDKVQTEVYQTKILRLRWDNKDAIAVMFNDMTQQETIMKLRLSDEHKDKVITTVSHELRTPINGILRLLNMMEKSLQDQIMLGHLSACKHSANLLLNLVNSILDMSQIRARCISIVPSSFNLVDTLEEIRPIFQLQCDMKGLKLYFNIAKDLPRPIFTDKNRLSQIIINLLANAVKFTFKGSISLNVENNPHDSETISFKVVDTGVGIKEEDKSKLCKMYGRIEQNQSINTQGTGLGLTISNELVKLLNPSDVQAKLLIDSEFEKGTTIGFYISKNLNANQVTGTNPLYLESYDELSFEKGGIDHVHPLSVGVACKFISSCRTPVVHLNDIIAKVPIHLKKAQVQTDRPYNNHIGTIKKDTFNFSSEGSMSRNDELQPITNDYSNPMVHTKSSMIPKVDGAWALLVDDNPFNLMVARYLLEEKGYRVKTALNGKESIQVVEEHYKSQEMFKFILMDCQMPVMDGYEATRVLKNMMDKRMIPEIPIIALSANNSEQDIQMGYDSGMSGYLFKPLEEGPLLRTLENLQ